MAKEWEYKADLIKNKEIQKSFETWSRQDLIDCILDLKKQVAQLQSNAPVTDGKVENLSFNKAWSIPTKIVFILTTENKPLLANAIFSKLTQLDKSFLDFNLPKTVLSNYLTRSVKTSRIVKIKNAGFRAHYFGLPEWLNDKAQLKEEYQNFIQKF